jgi:hypothetical protein
MKSRSHANLEICFVRFFSWIYAREQLRRRVLDNVTRQQLPGKPRSCLPLYRRSPTA